MNNYELISEVNQNNKKIQIRKNKGLFSVGHITENDSFIAHYSNLSELDLIKLLSTNINFNFIDPSKYKEHEYMLKFKNHPWLRTREEVRDWVLENMSYINGFNVREKFTESDLTIHDDLSVTLLKEYVSIDNTKRGLLPIKLREVKVLTSKDPQLQSLIGMPEKARVLCLEDCMIYNLEGLSGNIDVVKLDNNLLVDFKKMEKDLIVNELSLFRNDIKSWNGFIKEHPISIHYWKNSFNEKEIDLLLQTPDNVKSIKLYREFFGAANIKECPWTTQSGCYVDMEKLKLEKQERNTKKSTKPRV